MSTSDVPQSPIVPRIRQTATAEERARLKAYVRTGSAEAAARETGCCEKTVRNTYDRFRAVLEGLIDSIPDSKIVS